MYIYIHIQKLDISTVQRKFLEILTFICIIYQGCVFTLWRWKVYWYISVACGQSINNFHSLYPFTVHVTVLINSENLNIILLLFVFNRTYITMIIIVNYPMQKRLIPLFHCYFCYEGSYRPQRLFEHSSARVYLTVTALTTHSSANTAESLS